MGIAFFFIGVINLSKIGTYFINLFKKYDIWLFLSFIFLFMSFFYVKFYEVNNDLNIQSIPLQYSIIFGMVNIGILGLMISNFKSKINFIDVLGITAFFVYFFITLTINNPFFWVMLILVLLMILIRTFNYAKEEVPISQSKIFFERLNYRFPLFILVLLGIALAFCFYYIIENINVDDVPIFISTKYYITIYGAIIYLVLSQINNNKSVNVLDYFYFAWLFFDITFLALFKYNLAEAFAIPFICLMIRANTFDGTNVLRKKKYTSSLLAKYHLIFPIILALAASLIIRWSISQVDQTGIYYVFLSLVIVNVVLLAIALFFGKIKSKLIEKIDYGLLCSLAIELIILAFTISTITFKQYHFLYKNVLFLASVGVFGICLIVTLLLYYLRFKHFDKSLNSSPVMIAEPVILTTLEEEEEEDDSVEQDLEDREISETKEEAPTEEISEEVIEEQEVPDGEEEEEEAETLEENLDEEASASQESINFSNTGSKPKYLSRLMFADEKLKNNYAEVKNYMLSYGVTSRYSNNKETFRKKGLVAVIRVLEKSFNVYLNIMPEPFIEEGYNIRNASDIKQYEQTPLLIKIQTKKSITEFKEIFDVMMANKDIKKKAKFTKHNFKHELIPNGEAILNSLGYPSDKIVSSINAKIIPSDMPNNLKEYVPTIVGEQLEELVYTNVYTDTLCNFFTDGEVITKDLLIKKGVVRNPVAIKIKARGTLDKRLIIYADDFDLDALKMIYITNGTAILIQH